VLPENMENQDGKRIVSKSAWFPLLAALSIRDIGMIRTYFNETGK